MKQFVLILLLAPVLAAAGPLHRYEQSVDAMGTVFVVAAYGEDRTRLGAAVEAALDEAGRLDRLLSNYRPGSEWSEMNRTANQVPFKVSGELFRLLDKCR